MTNKKHQWLFERSFTGMDKYEQFIDWLRYEFYFLQQDHETFLTLYFPNGHFQVTKEIEKEEKVVSKIALESKCHKMGLKMKKRLSDFLDHMNRYQRLNEA